MQSTNGSSSFRLQSSTYGATSHKPWKEEAYVPTPQDDFLSYIDNSAMPAIKCKQKMIGNIFYKLKNTLTIEDIEEKVIIFGYKLENEGNKTITKQSKLAAYEKCSSLLRSIFNLLLNIKIYNAESRMTFNVFVLSEPKKFARSGENFVFNVLSFSFHGPASNNILSIGGAMELEEAFRTLRLSEVPTIETSPWLNH